MRQTPAILKRLGWAVLTALLAAALVLPSVDTRLWIAVFAILILSVSGTLLDTRWSRQHISWLRSPRTELRRLYVDASEAKGELKPYADGAPDFPHTEWRARIERLEARIAETMAGTVPHIWTHEERFRKIRVESLEGLDEHSAARQMHSLLNERLDMIAEAMREPGLD